MRALSFRRRRGSSKREGRGESNGERAQHGDLLETVGQLAAYSPSPLFGNAKALSSIA